MQVAILGPNLSGKNQGKGTLHVHRLDCLDLQRSYQSWEVDERGRGQPWSIEATSKLEVTFEIYGDHFTDYGYATEFAYQVMTGKAADVSPTERIPSVSELYSGYENDIWFAPCVSELD